MALPNGKANRVVVLISDRAGDTFLRVTLDAPNSYTVRTVHGAALAAPFTRGEVLAYLRRIAPIAGLQIVRRWGAR